MFVMCIFFFFKQKTAYEMRISDWSSDVCSSDLRNFRLTADNNAGNVYGGGTLVWLPTGLYSTRSIPIVKSREPLWDDPDLSRDVEQGRYFLPNSATGPRETIITSPPRAAPEYLQIMHSPTVWQLFAAFGRKTVVQGKRVSARGYRWFGR